MNPNLSSRQFVKLFHGTSADRVPAIQREGLHPSDSEYLLAYDHSFAAEYADDRARDRGEDPVVLHYRVPTHEWESYHGDDLDDAGPDTRVASITRSLPSKYIHRVERM